MSRELEAAAESSARTYDNFRRVLRYMEAQQQSSPVFEASICHRGVASLEGQFAESWNRAWNIDRWGGASWHRYRIAARSVRSRHPHQRAGLEGASNSLHRSCPRGQVRRRKTRCGVRGWRDPTRTCFIHNPRVEKHRAHQSFLSGLLQVHHSPDLPSSFLEIKLAIDSMNRSGKRNQVIGITSTQLDEGKSTVAAASALLMAHAGASVVLVDCNLRNRSLSNALAPAAEFGVLDVLSGAVSVCEVTWIEPITQLAFLPVGNNSRPIYASEVLASETSIDCFKLFAEPTNTSLSICQRWRRLRTSGPQWAR